MAKTLAGRLIGTPSLSPEQALGGTADDVRTCTGVGVMFYELLTGQRDVRRVVAGRPVRDAQERGRFRKLPEPFAVISVPRALVAKKPELALPEREDAFGGLLEYILARPGESRDRRMGTFLVS
jgi:hypothetical protein